MGFEYWIVDPIKSENYGLESLEIAKVIGYDEGMAFANRVVGVSHWARGNGDLAFKFLFHAESLYQQLKDTLGIANCLLNIGMVYTDQQNFETAHQHYQNALNLFQELKEGLQNSNYLY